MGLVICFILLDPIFSKNLLLLKDVQHIILAYALVFFDVEELEIWRSLYAS